MFQLKVLVAAILFHSGNTCTEFFTKVKDGGVVVGRTMELDFEINSDVVYERKGTVQKSYLPHFCGKIKPLKWIFKYDVLCMNSLKMPLCNDGMNSAGFSVGALYLPQYTKYDEVSEKDCSNMVPYLQLVNYLLATYGSTNELRKTINEGIFPKVPDMKFRGESFSFHFTITDSTGDAVVLEYTKDGRKIHNNTVHVTTNSPPYDFHMMNIKNYVKLSKFRSPDLKLGGDTFTPVGGGSGLIGIPGDFSPPSRFIRMATLLNFANTPNTTDEGVNLVYHLLNSVDIPKGVNQMTSGPREGSYGYTQWVVMRDLKNLVYYVRYYDDFTFRTIEMKKIRSERSGKVRVEGSYKKTVRDMTSALNDKRYIVPSN